MSKSSVFTILDGGFGRELQKRGGAIYPPLWSARAFFEAPEVIEQLHYDFIMAGAEVICTNAYALTRYYLAKVGKEDEQGELLDQAYYLAKKAITRSSKPVKIAAILPPLSETYRPDLLRSTKEMDDEYALHVHKAIEHGADIILGETLSSLVEAESIFKQINPERDLPVWISFTVNQDGNLRDGMSVKEAARCVVEMGGSAVLVNCATVDNIDKSIELLSEVDSEIPFHFGAYPNRFHEVRPDFTLESGLNTIDEGLTINEFIRHAHQWVDKGATIIGGCCGIGVDYIHALSLEREANK